MKKRISLIEEVEQVYEEIDIFCPSCGKKTVYQQLNDIGDKTGRCCCINCHESFIINTGPDWSADTHALERKVKAA